MEGTNQGSFDVFALTTVHKEAIQALRTFIGNVPLVVVARVYEKVGNKLIVVLPLKLDACLLIILVELNHLAQKELLHVCLEDRP